MSLLVSSTLKVAPKPEKFVDVQNVAAAVGHNMCCALPGLPSFTG